MTRTCLPVTTSQRRKVESITCKPADQPPAPVAKNRPSCENDSESTFDSWPFRECTCFPVTTSVRCTSELKKADASSLWSRENAIRGPPEDIGINGFGLIG